MRPFSKFVLAASLAFAALIINPPTAGAHCDTLDGPVVAAARIALRTGDIRPALKWVKPQAEAELRTAFQRTLAVRSGSADAKALADTYFFETLVRLHRAGEGAPYTGLKPSGTVPAVLTSADKALDGGPLDPLIARLTRDVAAGLRDRFNRAAEAARHANDSVEAGRRYVEAYVEYVHYVETLHDLATGHAATPHPAPAAGKPEPGLAPLSQHSGAREEFR